MSRSMKHGLLQKAKVQALHVGRINTCAIEIYTTLHLLTKVIWVRSSNKILQKHVICAANILTMQRYYTVTFGKNNRRVIGPNIWNHVPRKDSSCMTCVQSRGGVQYSGGVQYPGGVQYLDACEGISWVPWGISWCMWGISWVPWEGVFRTVRGTILCNLSTMGWYHDTCGGYHEYRGVFSTVGVLK